MWKNPLISIVLTLYNKKDYIEEQIFSIYQQSYSNWELIIVDDCSTDWSFEKAKEFCSKLWIESKCTFIQNEKNLWVAKTFEKWLKNVNWDYVAMADADDLWMRDRLEIAINYLQAHPWIKFIYWDLTTIDEENRVINQKFYKNSILLSLANKICPYPMAITSSVLFSTEASNELLKLWFPDKKRNIWQDYRISHFFVCRYWWDKIAYIDTPLAYYRRAPWAITLWQRKTKERYIWSRLKFIELTEYVLNNKSYNKENTKFVQEMKIINNKLKEYIEKKTSIFSLSRTIIKTKNFRWFYLLAQYFKDVN